MSKVNAVLDRIETEQRGQVDDELIPDHIPLPELAEQVVRGKRKLSPAQMRMLIELLPYVRPKLTAVAVGHLTGENFYNRLERAINRSNNAKVIEHQPAQPAQVSQVDERRRSSCEGRFRRR
jgi:hypothetical protein